MNGSLVSLGAVAALAAAGAVARRGSREVAWHGSPVAFPLPQARPNWGTFGPGVYFTTSEKEAAEYASKDGRSGHVTACDVRLENPLFFHRVYVPSDLKYSEFMSVKYANSESIQCVLEKDSADSAGSVKKLEAMGFDGIIVFVGPNQVVVSEPARATRTYYVVFDAARSCAKTAARGSPALLDYAGMTDDELAESESHQRTSLKRRHHQRARMHPSVFRPPEVAQAQRQVAWREEEMGAIREQQTRRGVPVGSRAAIGNRGTFDRGDARVNFNVQANALTMFHGSPYGGLASFDAFIGDLYLSPTREQALHYTRAGSGDEHPLATCRRMPPGVTSRTPTLYTVRVHDAKLLDLRREGAKHEYTRWRTAILADTARLDADEDLRSSWPKITAPHALYHTGLPGWGRGLIIAEEAKQHGYDGMWLHEDGADISVLLWNFRGKATITKATRVSHNRGTR